MKIRYDKMGIDIPPINEVPELLEWYGYGRVRPISDVEFETERAGVRLPYIHAVESNRYGDIIRMVREERGLSAANFATTLLITPQELEAVENGTVWLSENELNMAASVLELSTDALSQGEIRPRTRMDQLQERIDEGKGEIQGVLEQINMIMHDLNADSRYYAALYDGDSTVEWSVFDHEKQSFMIDFNTKETVICDTLVDAMSIAEEMNVHPSTDEYYHKDKEESPIEATDEAEMEQSVSDSDTEESKEYNYADMAEEYAPRM